MDLADRVVRHRLPLLIAWGFGLALLLPRAEQLSSRLAAEIQITGSESAVVEARLAGEFGSPFARSAVLAIRGLPPLSTPAGRRALQGLVSAVDLLPDVTTTYSWLNGGDSLFLGSIPGSTFVLVGLEPTSVDEAAVVRSLRSATAGAVAEAGIPGVTARWTGSFPVAVDLRRASERDARASELRALPVTLILLLLVFGAAAAALVPLVVGVFAVGITLGASALLAGHWMLSVMLQNVVSLLGLALGVDYALLMVSRFREALAHERSPTAAAKEAARQGGRTILVSGSTVIIGFAGLLLVDITELRSIAVGGMIVVFVAVLLATTLLPGLLSWLGGRVDAGRIPWSRPTQTAARGGIGWRRWGTAVVAHPWVVLLAGAIPLVLLALPARHLDPETPRKWLPPGMEAEAALEDLRSMGRDGVVYTLRILAQPRSGARILDPSGWQTTARLGRELEADPRVAWVRSLPAIAATTGVSRALVQAFLPDSIRARLLSRDGRVALVEVVPTSGVDMGELAAMVRQIRSGNPSIADVQLAVGGLPAVQADYEDAVVRSLPRVLVFILGGTFVALLVGFRSLLVPAKAIILNLLSVGVAFGLLVLVFQDGYGVRLFGFSGPLEGVFPAVPILAFCIVFGLSMDYEVFLVSRVQEARKAGEAEADAIVEGLARTGRVITSAAAVMVVIFAAFTFGKYAPAKLLGFTLAVAVFVDAAVVRTVIGPALLRLAGRWNWWPGDRAGR
ncbi:MAG: MMPL family transporter [Gemmatimonadota bacterium]